MHITLFCKSSAKQTIFIENIRYNSVVRPSLGQLGMFISAVQGVQARRVGQIKSGAKRQHIKGWEDGRKRRLRCRGLGRDALRHSLRHRSAVPLVEIAAGVAPGDIAALIRGESMLLKLTISFFPPSRIGLRQNKAPTIRTDRRRRFTVSLRAKPFFSEGRVGD